MNPHTTPKQHLVIAGNIGSGKTTLTKMLTKHYRWIPIFEDIETNPYLMDFYQNMAQWSFNVQVYFLTTRFKQLIEIQKGTAHVIQDRSIYEDVYIFATCLKDLGLLSERDYKTYTDLYEAFYALMTPPTLLIYLRSSIPNLVEQIQRRGRDYEENIRLDYLKKLNKYYEDWIQNYHESPLLIIDVEQNHFTDKKQDLTHIIHQIDQLLIPKS